MSARTNARTPARAAAPAPAAVSHFAVSSPATVSTRWELGPAEPRLAPGAVHVWRADLAQLDDATLPALDRHERRRAAAIASERDRLLWTRSRALLRALLARYLRVDASAVRLTGGARGKPMLAGGDRGAPRELSFNLAHSRHLALYALSAAGEVGVDVQVARDPRHTASVDPVALARRAFGDAQARRLSALDAHARQDEFLRLWTRHEAELKRTGIGIGGAGVGDGDLGITGEAPFVAELDVGPRTAAALALARQPSELCLWEWR
jgi:4'-phosphopantetheinyl transferase